MAMIINIGHVGEAEEKTSPGTFSGAVVDNVRTIFQRATGYIYTKLKLGTLASINHFSFS